MVSYKNRPNAKDFIQVEIVVEKNSQKIILIGKVSLFYRHCLFYLYVLYSTDFIKMEMH